MAVNPQEIENSNSTINPFNKYIFPEFANSIGEKRLQSIMEKIVPIALALTWSRAVSFQAPGNGVYVGTRSIAEKRRAGERKIQMDLQALEERGLMRVSNEIHTETRNNQAMTSIRRYKDFSPLYQLAHDFYKWQESGNYDLLPPKWEHAEAIKSDPELYKKLVRFECYRLILECKRPGRKKRKGDNQQRDHEEHNTKYDSNDDSPYRINPIGLYDSNDDSSLHTQKELKERVTQDACSKRDSYSPNTGYTNQPSKPEQIELFESSEPDQTEELAANQSAEPENITDGQPQPVENELERARAAHQGQGQQAKEPASSRKAQGRDGGLSPSAEPKQLHDITALKKPSVWNYDTIFLYLKDLDRIKTYRKLPHLPWDIVSELPAYLSALKDQQPSSTYGFLLNIWTRFNLAGGSVDEFKMYLEEIATYCYGAPKTSRTPARPGATSKPQPQGIQLFVTLTRNNLELYLSGQEWRPEIIKAMQQAQYQQSYTTSSVHIVSKRNVVESNIITVTDDNKIETSRQCSTVYTDSEITSQIPALEEDESTMSITADHDNNKNIQTNEQVRAIQIIQANKTVAGVETESVEQHNTNAVEAVRVAQANEVKPTAELYRHQRIVEAIESLRGFIDDPLYPQNCERACITCGSTIRTRGARCVVCSPLPTWDSRTRERILKIMKKIPTLQQAQEIVSRS